MIMGDSLTAFRSGTIGSSKRRGHAAVQLPLPRPSTSSCVCMPGGLDRLC